MTFIGHMAAGFLLGNALEVSGAPDIVIPVTTVVAALPDIDGLVYFAAKRKIAIEDDFAHHRWFTHKPVFWFGILILTGIARVISPSYMPLWLVWSYIVGIGSHLILDCIGTTDGIQWLWPFSKKWCIFWEVEASKGEWLRLYLEHPSAWVERIVIAVAVFAAILRIDLL